MAKGQEKSEEMSRIVNRLNSLRNSMQCTWAELGEEIGLSESMIYQVKSGARKLSSKAEHRLAIAEREEGLAPAIEPIFRRSSTPEEAMATFARASTTEQLGILRKDTAFWRLFFEIVLSDIVSTFKLRNNEIAEFARLAKDVSKSPQDKALLKKLLSRANAILATEREIEYSISKKIDDIRESVDRLFTE